VAENVPLMRTVLAVASAASFSGAAKALGLSRAAVSSQIAQLEARLGVRLFRRTTRTVALTSEGEQYADRVGALLEQIDALDNEYAARAGEVAGPLMVEVPEFFGVRVLASRVPEFLERYPAVNLNLVLNEKVDDVAHADADILVRSSLPQAHHLKYRRLGGFRLIAAASPRYLAKQGEPRHPRELGQHTTIDYINSVSGQPFEWEFEPVRRGRGEPLVVAPKGRLTCNNSDACIEAAIAGFGIVTDVDFMLAPLFERKLLVPVLTAWHSPEYPLFALWHPGRPVAPRITAFVEFLAQVAETGPLQG
jgi:LysR family transcriptional regulator for bpeEF and oprC